jgi:hypothetical protein
MNEAKNLTGIPKPPRSEFGVYVNDELMLTYIDPVHTDGMVGLWVGFSKAVAQNQSL